VESVLAVAREEKLPTDAKEIIKDPMVLEFLGLKREANGEFHKQTQILKKLAYAPQPFLFRVPTILEIVCFRVLC